LGQLLRLSAHSKKELRLAEQIKALHTLLDSFGNAKTLMSPNASRHARYLELHFSETGRIISAKILAFGLDKNRLIRLTHEERTYHIFYQFIAGATPTERDSFNIEDPSDYALLASSGCYRLPAGPFSDDSIAMTELRAAMRTLGFKPKHMTSIFSLILAVLLLGNLQFGAGDAHDVSAHVSNLHVLEQVAKLLGVAEDELTQILTNRTSYVRKELFTTLLDAEQSACQRDQFVKDIYSMLFAFIVETCNHRLAQGSRDTPPLTQVVLFDQPGFQTRGPAGTTSISLSGNQPLISAYGQNGFDEFCINFSAELLHSYYIKHTFETVGYSGQIAGDGVSLPDISTMDNGSCVELLRGSLISERAQRKPGGLLGVVNKACSAFKSGKDGDSRNDDLVQELSSRYSVHTSFVPSSSGTSDRRSFGINHYTSSCSYDISQFVEKDADLLDSAFVSLLRNSSEPFVSKLFSGPSLAAERHSKDDGIIVQAQVSSRPLRQPSPIFSTDKTPPPAEDEHPRLDPNKTYPITTQLNFSLSEIFSSLDRTRLWSILCIRPNDSSSPNSFDKRRVKSQIRGLLLPDVIARRSVEYVVDFELGSFCDRYVPTMRGSEHERIIQCARANGWKEGMDYICGHRSIWLSYEAWKMVEDTLRAQEKEMKQGSREGEEEEDYAPDDNTDFTHAPAGSVYFGESVENLLLTRTGTDGTMYKDPNAPYGSGGLRGPTYGSKGLAPPDDPAAWSESDKKEPGTPELPYPSRGGDGPEKGTGGGLMVKEAPVEEVPSSKTRRWWLRLVWLCTFWIPSFCLNHIGRMKRPDVRMAWREKLTIFWLIFLMNGVVIFYIVEFGRLLCPNFDKAWSLNEVNQHTGDNDFWVAIQGVVYDVTNFIHGDHSNGEFGVKSNSPDILGVIAGQDLTYYFPPPLVLGCRGLVTDDNLLLSRQNFTDIAPLMHHTSGKLQTTSPEMSNPDWYINTFWPKMQTMKKGPLVWDWGAIEGGASNTDDAR
jgi:chitin synthase